MNVTKSPLIHIGFAKCASTSIQRSFFSICPKITYLGVQMKSRVKRNDAYDALFSLATLSRLDYLDQKKKIENCIYSYLKDKSHVVISNEVFSSSNYTPYQHQTWNDTLTIGERLKDLFPEAKILIIIRNQLNALPSIFAEISKHPHVTVKWNDYIDNAIISNKMGRGSVLHRLNYYQIYKAYVDLFGKKNVTIMLMEELILEPNKFFQNLIKLCDIADIVSASKFRLLKENRRATNWDYYAINLKQKAEKLLPNIIMRSIKKNSLIRDINELMRSFSGSPSYELSKEQGKYINDYYKTSNKMLFDETDLNLKSAGYPYP